MRYESEILYDLMKRDGLLNPPQNKLPYESELKEKYLNDVVGAYPKLQDYRSEWLNYALEDGNIGEFPYVTLTNVTNATINNVVPYAYKSAILKGQTLVNQLDLSKWGEQEKITFIADGTSKIIHLNHPVNIKANTKYLTIIPIYENTINNNFTIGGWNYYGNQPTITNADGTGIIKKIATTNDSDDSFNRELDIELWKEKAILL